jgi:hypothetical protein
MSPDQTQNRTQNVLDGLLRRDEIAKQLDCVERTIIRYERMGMPFIAVGKLRLYDPTAVREWLLSQTRRPSVPRRGRPRTNTAGCV